MLSLKSSFAFLQKIGKSLMLPVSLLPIAGLLLGIGGALLSGVERGAIQIDSQFLLTFFEVLRASGEPIFANLPMIFAIGVALGLTNNDGVASLAVIVGYVVMLGTMGVIAPFWGVETQSVMGITSINTGVFGGIIVGCLAAAIFNRFYRIELPPYLGFFSGKRSVPIITAMAAIGLGFLLSLIWPPIGKGIRYLSNLATSGDMSLTVFVYGLGERLLLPFGLHHIWNVPFFFEIGDFVTPSGKVVHGEITRFFAGDPTAGNLGGGYLVKMFGLPAAALAMWQCAKPENKTKVGGIMISAALTSFLTGITEPIEFSFLFIAPLLYLVHALFSGLSFVLVYNLGAKLGYTFSHGFIDYVLFFPAATKPWVVFAVGPLYFILYYVTFRFAIQKWNIATPGRGEEPLTPEANGAEGGSSLAGQVVAALGGGANIDSLDACITRLRVSLKDINKADDQKLKSLGAVGVVRVGNGLQAIFGTQSENLKTAMEVFLRQQGEAVKVIPSQNKTVAASPSAKAKESAVSQEIQKKAADLAQAFGGISNLSAVAACSLTRLRIEVKEPRLVRRELIEKIAPMMEVSGRRWHVLVGFESESYQTWFDKERAKA